MAAAGSRGAEARAFSHQRGGNLSVGASRAHIPWWWDYSAKMLSNHSCTSSYSSWSNVSGLPQCLHAGDTQRSHHKSQHQDHDIFLCLTPTAGVQAALEAPASLASGAWHVADAATVSGSCTLSSNAVDYVNTKWCTPDEMGEGKEEMNTNHIFIRDVLFTQMLAGVPAHEPGKLPRADVWRWCKARELHTLWPHADSGETSDAAADGEAMKRSSSREAAALTRPRPILSSGAPG